MAPRTSQWLQERTWNAPTKGLAWTLPLSLSHSLTPSLLHSLTSSLSRSLTASLPHFFTPSLSHSFTPSLLHSLALSLSHSLPTAPSHSFTNSLPHPLTLSLPTLLHCLTLTLLRSLNPRGQRTRVHPTPKPVPLFRVRYSQVLLSVFVTSFFFSVFVTLNPCLFSVFVPLKSVRTPNPARKPRSPKRETYNLEPGTRNPEPKTLSAGCSCRGSGTRHLTPACRQR